MIAFLRVGQEGGNFMHSFEPPRTGLLYTTVCYAEPVLENAMKGKEESQRGHKTQDRHPQEHQGEGPHFMANICRA